MCAVLIIPIYCNLFLTSGAGDKLIAFDREKIAAAGHPDVVVVLVTNSDEYENLSIQTGTCQSLDKVIQV